MRTPYAFRSPLGNRRLPRLKSVLVGLAFVAVWWTLDAVLDAVIFREGTFVQELLFPAQRELVLRSLVAAGVFLFTLMHFRIVETDRHLEMFSTVVEQAGDAALWKDRTGRLLYVNEAACRMLGYSREELLKMNLKDIDPWLTPGEFDAIWERFSPQRQLRLERAHRTKSGRLIPVELSISYVTFGGTEYNCSFARDISERKAAAETLKKSQAALLLAQRVARLGSFELDIEQNTQVWSDELYRLHGLPPGAVEPSMELFIGHLDPEDRERVRNQFAQDLAARRPHLSVHRMIQSDGTRIWVRCQGELSMDADGKPVRMVGTVQDVTDLKRIEEELRERNRLKDLFTDIMRHDLMTPAGVIKMCTEFLLPLEQDANKRKFLGRIQRAAASVIELCENASKYARLADATQIEFGDFELGAILAETVASFQTQLKERRMILRFVSDGTYPARVSPLIADVFANLVSNAIKYSPEGTAVTVSISDHGDCWRVQVADQGPGIPDLDKPRVFNRFERLDRQVVRGTGLGLAIAHQVVGLHKGRIWIEDNPGSGSVFCVELPKGMPLAAAAPLAAPASLSAPASPGLAQTAAV